MFKSLYFGDLCGNVTMPCVPQSSVWGFISAGPACSTRCSSACLIVLTLVITRNIGRVVALLGARVEHLAAHAAGVRGCDPVQADVVQSAVTGVGQRRVEAEFAAGTSEPVGQGLHRLPCALLTRTRGGSPLSSTGLRVTVVSA